MKRAFDFSPSKKQVYEQMVKALMWMKGGFNIIFGCSGYESASMTKTGYRCIGIGSQLVKEWHYKLSKEKLRIH